MPLNVTFDYNFNEIVPPLADGDYKSTVKLTSYMQNDKRRVSMPPKDCSAVEVKRLRYVVGRGKKAKTILSGINMTVPEGAIYGLLGPSGSGKTTLLKNVVGQLAPTEGWVKVFGFQPNQPGSQIPGAAIGYMPQELAVYEDFTIRETLWYFGRLYRIPNKVIKERIEFLLNFLDLPRSERLINCMSGGQKRRVSLASALVHSPPLLILDEPTVGVDPLLRQSIWQHLVTLTQTEKITVIVTTHYIEEARRANIVGLMRRGKLLAENTPDDLMAQHNSSSLEDVFLKLCVTDTMRRAQKFASLTGMPINQLNSISARDCGDNNLSIVPTPEIQSKRDHQQQHHLANDECNNQTTIPTTAQSQSPDEGVNTNNSNSSNSSPNSIDGEVNSLEQQQHQPDLGVINATKQQVKNGGSGDETQTTSESCSSNMLDVSPNRSSVGSQGTTVEPNSYDNNATSVAVDLNDLQQDSKQANGGDMKQHDEQSIETKQQQQRPEKVSKKFQLKSLLKFGGSLASKDPISDQLEKRRQSGSYFLEQLTNKCQQQQNQLAIGNQQQQIAKPLHQLLSCDTTAVDNKHPHHNNRHQHRHHHHHQLEVPKISVHGMNYGTDYGTSSNNSSRNDSPISRNNNNNNPATTENNLITAAYANQSYQTSECGSTTFNDLALISSNNNSSNSNNNNNISSSTIIMNNDDDDVMLDPKLFMNPADLSTMSPGNKYDYKKQSAKEYCDTIGTITWKNYIRLKRNVPLLLFQFVLPAIQVILFCICVGNDPFDIPVAVVNEESSADSVASLSSQFLRSIDSHLVRQVNFTNLPAAIESVRGGQNWGVIHIPENFTISIHRRFAGMEMELDDATIENSTIKVYPDMTNQPIGHAMEVAFRRAYRDLSKQTFDFLGLNPALSDPPIRMEQAIYGKIDTQNYLQYMSPGVLISISYIMATGLTSLAFIIERRDGLYDRTLAAGVDHVQMLLSHSIVQLVVMVVQISLVVFFTFVIYKVPTNGPFIWVFLLLLLQGLAGMSFGLMVSAICKEENTAIMMILGTFYPNLLLAGVIWPIEAIPHWLRWFSYLQPQTLPTQSLRDLIVRGWDIDHPGVWSGFAVTTSWLFLFLIISCISFRIKK